MVTIFGELYSSKNSRIGIMVKDRNIVLKSPKAKAQEEDFQYQLSANRRKFASMFKGKPFPLRIKFKIYRKTNGIFDYTNIIQGLADAMVRADIIPNDDARHFIPFFEPYEVDPKNPRTEITLWQ